MQTNGIGGLAPQTQPAPQPQVRTGLPQRETTTPAATRPATESNGSARAATAGAAPEGVDPALWLQLTPAERVFYLRASALGPLTYQPGGPQQTAAPARGSRIDVRV